MDKRLFYLFGQAHRKLFRFIDKECEQRLGASNVQVAALMFIAKHPGCQQKELAAELDLNKSAITGLIALMEKNGLVTREGDDADARAVKLFATAEGLTKSRGLMPLINELNAFYTSEFNAEEMDVIYRFLHTTIKKF